LQTPLNLFDNEASIFRSLCNEAGLTRLDIERIRGSVTNTTRVQIEETM
jgi:ATP-binding cassette subfamily C (CFTR/MRP) protein 1